MAHAKEKNKFRLMAARPLTDEERRKSVRQAAGHALDAADLFELLAVIGLPAADGRLPLDPQ